MDNSLNSLSNVKKLSLSTNSIDKMISLPGLKNLEILSLGRNQIKKIQGLEEVGATLKELWISYNQIATLDGLHPCVSLTHLFIGNNKIKDFEELTKLNALPNLINFLGVGNPMYAGLEKRQQRSEVGDRLPNLKTIDGVLNTGDDAEESAMDRLKAKCSEKGDGAIESLGLPMGDIMEKAPFMDAVGKLGVDISDGDEIYNECGGDGAVSLAVLKEKLGI